MVEVFVPKIHMTKTTKRQIKFMRVLTKEWMKNEKREEKRGYRKNWKGFVKKGLKFNSSFQI